MTFLVKLISGIIKYIHVKITGTISGIVVLRVDYMKVDLDSLKTLVAFKVKLLNLDR